MESKYRPSDLARWMRRRRKRRNAAATGESVGFDPDFYDDDGEHYEDPKTEAVIVIGAFLIALMVIGFLLFRSLFGGDSTETIIGSPPITVATTASSGSTPPPSDAPPPSEPEAQPPIGDDVLDRALRDLGLDGVIRSEDLGEFGDAVRDFIDSVMSLTAAYQGPDVDIVRAIVFRYAGSLAFQNAGFNDSVYECGDTDPVVACATQVLDMPAGDTLVIAVQLDAPIPAASPDRSYRYSVVFDSDDDAANDWRFVDPFEWDYFQGADRWYQAIYESSTGEWFVEVTQLAEDGSIPADATASAVRFVATGDWGVFFIPSVEFAEYPPAFRVSAFGHDGSFSEASRGGDVLGANPTERLFTPPPGVAITTE